LLLMESIEAGKKDNDAAMQKSHARSRETHRPCGQGRTRDRGAGRRQAIPCSRARRADEGALLLRVVARWLRGALVSGRAS